MSEHSHHPRATGLSAARDHTVADGSMADLGRELAELAGNLPGSLRSLHVRSGDQEIHVEWGELPAAAAAAHPATSHEPAQAEVEGTGVAVRAPLVGTYYASPSPDAPPFVRPGDVVEQGQTVAIVEAMKMMNPVVAEQAGRVGEVLVVNGASVEFDQALITLLPVEDA